MRQIRTSRPARAYVYSISSRKRLNCRRISPYNEEKHRGGVQ